MSFVLNVIAKPIVILTCAAVLSMLLRRSSASVRHAVWILALASVVVIPVAALLVPQLEWSVLPEASTSVTFLPVDSGHDAIAEVERGLRASTTYLADGVRQVGFQPAVLWVFGVTFFLVRLVMGAVAVRRIPKMTPAALDDGWGKFLGEISQALHIRRPARLLVSQAQLSPITWGVRRHTILLPSTANQWSEERRRLVLAHELAHVKRNDGLIQIFVQLVCAIYWFNPLVWYAAHRVRIERERACDDHVLALGMAATDYADHLIQIVRGLRGQSALSFAAVSMAQSSHLETRLVSILDSRASRQRLSKAGAILLCALTVLLTISMAAIGVTAAVPLPPVVVTVMKAASPEPAAEPATTPQRTRIGRAETIPNNAVTAPNVLESAPPSYTPEGVQANVEGTVTLEGHVDIKGKVSGLRVVKGLGYGLDQKAIEAVLGWRFAPALRKGAPAEAITQIEVDFRIPPWFKPAPVDEETPIRIGAGVTPPKVVFRVEPQYTPEARAAKYKGTVIVSATIHKDGTLTVNEVLQELDYGLTPKAIEALEQWKFEPGKKDGKDVSVSLNVEVNFNLR